jgi:hypothetical protein
VCPDDRDPDVQTLLPIVVGAHLRAEVHDRPLGETVREAVRSWQAAHRDATPLTPLVCTDLWYLNAPDLMLRPTIAIGDPAFNAAAAFFANRLPTTLVVEEGYQVQLDPEFVTLQVCLWGVSDASNRAAVSVFLERYLDPFLRNACGLPAAG